MVEGLPGFVSLILDAILDHIEATSFDRLPPDVVDKTNTVIADTLACALIGSAESHASTVRDIQLVHYGYGGVPVWGTDLLLSPIGAGIANGYQSHCSDCVCSHETVGVQPMAVIQPAVMAYADRFGKVPGKDIITAVNIGNDVAILLALAANREGRFFRSSVCGAVGAGAAIAKLADLDRPTTAEFFGLIYSQLGGPQLSDGLSNTDTDHAPSLQVAFAVRNVLTAFDLIRQYLAAPAYVFGEPSGYFAVIEPGGDPATLLGNLGKTWRTSEMSFSPISTGALHREKFMHGALSAAQPLNKETAERLYGRLLALQNENDVSVLSALASGVDLEKEILS